MTEGFGHRRVLAPRHDASHAIRVPRVRILPSASFRSHLTMGTLAVRLGVPVIKASKGLAPSSHFPVGFRLPVDSARQGAARHAWRTSGRPGSLLTLAPHRSGRAGSAASGSSTDSFATRRRVPAGPGSQAMATAIPKAYLASSAIRCRDVETGPTLGVLAVFPSTGATCRGPLPSTGSRGLNAPASAVSGRRRRPSKGSPPSAAQTVRAVFPHTAFTRLPGGREMEGVNEWTFCSPVGLSQSASLLGRSLLGLSHKELIRAIGLTHSRPAVSPTTLPTDFPSPPGCRSRGRTAFTARQVLFGRPTPRTTSPSTSPSDL